MSDSSAAPPPIGGPASSEGDFPGPGARSWGPNRWMVIGAFLLAAAAFCWAALATQPTDRLVGAAVGVALALAALAGFRRRLVAGPYGFVVRGLLGARRWTWSAVSDISLGQGRRLGIVNATLEVDLDHDVLVFGRTDLGVDPGSVLQTIERWWPPG